MDNAPAPPRPRVAITFCVKCKWNLRAAYYAQELLQTFADTLGEVALIPVSGGIFTISVDDIQIWDRATDGGFPDTKELKNRVRNLVDPDRDMGHVDRALRRAKLAATEDHQAVSGQDATEEHGHDASHPPDDCVECRDAAAAK